MVVPQMQKGDYILVEKVLDPLLQLMLCKMS